MATTNYSWNLPTVGGSEDTWGTLLNSNWTALDTLLGGINATEFSALSGVTSNIQDQIDAAVASGNNSTITIAGSTGVTGGGSFTLNQASDETVTVTGVTLSNAAWQSGTDTTEAVVSPAKISAAILSLGGGGLGAGQLWNDYTASRASGATYTNTSGKPIMINVNTVGPGYLRCQINGITFEMAGAGFGQTDYTSVGNTIVPAGATYSVTVFNSTIETWYELR